MSSSKDVGPFSPAIWPTEDVYALPPRNSSSRSGNCSSLPRFASRRSVMQDEKRTGSSSVCWYQATQFHLPVSIWETSLLINPPSPISSSS